MVYTVKEFCNYISRNRIDELADSVFQSTGRSLGPNERESYKKVSVMLKKAVSRNQALADCHIALDTSLLLEYKLPAASAWCDLVLLGKSNHGKYQIVIVELKNWQVNNTDTPGVAEGLIIHKNEDYSHPSQQVRGYTEYCKRFHSTVQELQADCNGVVYFTQPIDLKPYQLPPNDRLVAEYPVFNTDSSDRLAEYITEHIQKADAEFASKFVKGVYKQDRNILRQVAENLKSYADKDIKSPFQLLSEQQLSYDLVMSKMAERIEDGKKQVIIVEGPPGSGKSAVAINIWCAAALKYTEHNEGNCVFVTTSQSQEHNWSEVFKTYGGRVAKGLIQKSTSYNAGISSTNHPQIVEEMVHDEEGKNLLTPNLKRIETSKYREVTEYLIKHGWAAAADYCDNKHLLSVVDEAHALINPLSPDYLGFNQGWAPFRGPQAYHIIRKSQISVFFTDTAQSFREYESTSTEDIEEFAEELGAEIKKISLEGMQFRCAGSTDFVEWVDRLFDKNPAENYSKWSKQYSVSVVDYPSEVENFLRSKITDEDHSVRLLSSYTRKWVSSGKVTAKHRSSAPLDFDIADKDGTRFRKFWNSDYAAFVQASARSSMEEDPLSEVGCPYVVRGFDYSWIGLLWLKDMIYRKEFGGWCISSKYLEETAIKTIRSKALKEFKKLPNNIQKKCVLDGEPLFTQDMAVNCENISRLFKAQAQAYRILLTRALRGVCMYIEDPETRNYIRKQLK